MTILYFPVVFSLFCGELIFYIQTITDYNLEISYLVLSVVDTCGRAWSNFCWSCRTDIYNKSSITFKNVYFIFASLSNNELPSLVIFSLIINSLLYSSYESNFLSSTYWSSCPIIRLFVWQSAWLIDSTFFLEATISAYS